MRPSLFSPCGRYVALEATPDAIVSVVMNLSEDEQDERIRLGITSLEPLLEEAEKRRALALMQPIDGATAPLLVWGTTEEGVTWLLPTQECVDKHARFLASKKSCAWILEHFWYFAPDKAVIYNGVTPEATRVIAWLKKSMGATFSNTPLPTAFNGALALPFFFHRPAGS